MSLHAAAAANDLATVQRLLALGADPETLGDRGWSPLALAARHASDWRILSRLALAGAIPHRRIGDKADSPTPLHIAAFAGNIPALRHLIILIRSDPHTNSPDLDPGYVFDDHSMVIAGVTPLHLAAWHNHSEAVMELLRAGANAAKTDAYGCGFLHYAAAGEPVPPGGGMAVAAMAAAALGADVGGRLGHAYAKCDSLPIHFAAFFRNAEILEVLLRCGADATARDHEGLTPLALFCRGNDGSPRPISWPRDAAIVARLVAAGDRSWGVQPTPCPGLEAALPAVWEAAHEELPQLFQRLTEGAQRRVQAALRALHRVLPAPGYAALRMAILKEALAGCYREGVEEESGQA